MKKNLHSAIPFRLNSICFSKKIILIVFLTLFFIRGHAQIGRVGINTNNPTATLHVADSSVLFSAPSGINNVINTPIQGPGSRMMWFAPRKAFRVGHVQSNRWDRDSIGSLSFAAGYNTLASGPYATAFGYNTSASAWASFASGDGSSASGEYTFAAGVNSYSTGISTVAMGYGAVATGWASVSLGHSNLAGGPGASFATGYNTKALGWASSTFGMSTAASADRAAAFGSSTMAKAFCSFVVGSFNDSTNYDVYQWILTEPLFVIGNGTSNSQRSNALTLLKNGNLGLGTTTPSFRLHVSNNNPEDGGYQEGIMIENTNTYPDVGEAALSFRNKALPSNKQWTIGMNSDPVLAFSYGINFNAGNTRMVLDTFGRLGINNITPQAQLHVVRDEPSGGPFSSNAMAIFESNNVSYIQLSNENIDESGILSGNQDHYVRSGIIFRADSSIHFRTGGNNTKMVISTEGNVGIGTSSPTTKLHVNGTTRFGVNGNTITEIIRATVNANVASIPANGGTVAHLFTVTNAALTSAVSVSPGSILNAGLVIGSVRVSGVNTVEVRFVNITSSAIDPPVMDYYFTIIR